MTSSEVSPERREELWARARGFCEVCSYRLPVEWAAHHRKLRSQGGTDALSNLIACHHLCHNGKTTSIHLRPKRAHELGYIVRRGEDPLAVPLLLYGPRGWWVRLTDEGTYIRTEHEET